MKTCGALRPLEFLGRSRDLTHLVAKVRCEVQAVENSNVELATYFHASFVCFSNRDSRSDARENPWRSKAAVSLSSDTRTARTTEIQPVSSGLVQKRRAGAMPGGPLVTP